ncbi:diguanylate cyclase [Synechococcus sp. CCY9202]|uniref:GGDEF domain-containing protein n=1 Tax=Synechococcus sp. CCY9202 TaxID=174698 RepID=UPI002B220985|nr:diguanylate cyclase [Synechococcus sp. CCY9202]MEA5422367.1 diguanylate cyclase [Synechococcus sp. CCY9202]
MPWKPNLSRALRPRRLLQEFLPIVALLSGLLSLGIWPLVHSIEEAELATLRAEAQGALQESRRDLNWRFFETLADIRVISQLPRVREAVNNPSPDRLLVLNGIFHTFMESYGRYSAFSLINRQGTAVVQETMTGLVSPRLPSERNTSTTCGEITHEHPSLLAKAWSLPAGQFVVSSVYHHKVANQGCEPLLALAVPQADATGKVRFVMLVHVLLSPLLQEQRRILQLHHTSALTAILDAQGHLINSNTPGFRTRSAPDGWSARPDLDTWRSIQHTLFQERATQGSLLVDKQGLFIFAQVNPLNTEQVLVQSGKGVIRPSRRILAMEPQAWPWVLLIQIPTKSLQAREFLGQSGSGTLLVVLYLSTALLALSLAYARLLGKIGHEEEQRHSAELELLARTDSLTGLPNRRSLEELASYELARWQRHRIPLAILMLDLDHFKSVNDQYGHAVGDAVLVAFSRSCQAELRNTDTLARWGGEEFLALLPNTDRCQAETLAERLRQAVAAISIATLRITTSIGIATCHDDSGNFDNPVARSG